MFTFFRHDQLRRYISAFGSLFKEIQIQRVEKDGDVKQQISVPIEYGPKERWYTRLQQDPDFTKSVATVLPRMSYQMSGLTYDGTRAQKMLDHMSFASGDTRRLARLYVGVPYNINFELSCLTKYQSDAFQIVEQIFPYFRPDLTIAIQPFEALDFEDQIPVICNTVTENDNYEGDFETRRMITWTFQFAMKVYFYGPTRSASRIQRVVVDIHNLSDQIDGNLEVLQTEDGLNTFNTESGEAVVTEETPDEFLNDTRLARIEVVADPENQDPNSPDIQSVTTITEELDGTPEDSN